MGQLCTACAGGGISHVIVALLTFQATIRGREGRRERVAGEGVLNPCGFVGCDLPCVQVTEPLPPLPLPLQNKCRCYLFHTHRLLATSHRGWIFFFFFEFLTARVGFAEDCRTSHFWPRCPFWRIRIKGHVSGRSGSLPHGPD